ncbi:hypothetical protein BJ508DRAFT_313783 [Ascobolus immersus RN42]|uniref:Uncharacterized protein n=1 Tax=Ascobolus immersus RN42 TaxID=1160509 RepID=A0A3N4HMZ4_ASCIM|nr:hypothetical protein BJ508DRAFT_313783 [Ascobolus immersus RN42]
MASSPTTCLFCNNVFADENEKRHHFLVEHDNLCKLFFTTPEADPNQPLYNIMIWRASDLHFRCPFKGCDFRVIDLGAFIRHFPKNKSCVWTLSSEHKPQSDNLEFKRGVNERYDLPLCFEYNPETSPVMVDAGTDPRPASLLLTSTIIDSPSDAFSTNLQTHASPQQIIETTASPLQTSNPTLVPAIATASPSTNVAVWTGEQLRASLRNEYMRRLHGDMMATLGDNTVDLKESGKRQEELKNWFENGMKLLKEAEGEDLCL